MKNSWLEKHKKDLINIVYVDKKDNSLVINFNLESTSAVIKDYLEMMIEEIVDENIGTEENNKLVISSDKLDLLDDDSMDLIEFILEESNKSIDDFRDTSSLSSKVVKENVPKKKAPSTIKQEPKVQVEKQIVEPLKSTKEQQVSKPKTEKNIPTDRYDKNGFDKDRNHKITGTKYDENGFNKEGTVHIYTKQHKDKYGYKRTDYQKNSGLKQQLTNSREYYLTLSYPQIKQLINDGNISSELKLVAYEKEDEYFNQVTHLALMRIKKQGNSHYISHKLLEEHLKKKEDERNQPQKSKSKSKSLSKEDAERKRYMNLTYKELDRLSRNDKSKILYEVLEFKKTEKQKNVVSKSKPTPLVKKEVVNDSKVEESTYQDKISTSYQSVSYFDLKNRAKTTDINNLISYAIKNKLYIK